MNKKYLIDEDTLRQLLYDSHKLAILEGDGVDNWQWYMEGMDDHIAMSMLFLPWNENRSRSDMQKVINDEGYTLDDLVDDEINAFWEEAK